MTAVFQPRPWQKPMLDHVLAHDRCALWAGMGLGKTAVTMTALDALYLGGESHPTLILGPLRVARKVWTDERNKWAHLSGLSVVPIIGSEEERLAALRYDAPIYTVNYDNIVWLIEHYGDRWPFRTVVADESDYIKGHRISFRTSSKGKEYIAGQGAKRAGALARIAHSHITRFLELTGTPAPNGLADLWGQLWYLDRGQRLGRTFDAFKTRWFRPSDNGYGIEALPHANDQIQRAIGDICLTIDGKDWFDLKAPLINNVYVELTGPARKLYKDMEKEMFAQIGDRTAEAFHAAARTQKCLQLCLAEGTEVLTDRGWVAIEAVTSADRLWDGMQWVQHEGLVYNGTRDVIICAGVRMTPEHKLLTRSGWKTAEEIQRAEQNSGYDWPSVRLPDGYQSGGLGGIPYREQKGALASALRVWERGYPNRDKPSAADKRPKKILRLPASRDAAGRVGVTRHDGPPCAQYLGRDAATVRKSEQQRLEELWWPGHNCVRKVAGFLRKLLGRYGAVICRGALDRPKRQLEGVQPRKLSMGYAEDAGEQYPTEQGNRNAKWPDDSKAGLRSLRDEVCDAARQDIPVWVFDRKGVNSAGTAKVYDIKDAGPLNRFTIRAPDGTVFISHNCNGAIYVDPLADTDDHPKAKEWRRVHDEKLDALESIAHETGGAPLLVCYEFKSDLARLLKAFPKGRALKTEDDENDFKKGKIPMLFLHPKSGGHGIDGFQYACNNIVFFGHNWSLGQYQQVVERIGPTRQMQAGFERPVWIHHIIARGTVDELVMERRETKREVQDILLAACKRA